MLEKLCERMDTEAEFARVLANTSFDEDGLNERRGVFKRTLLHQCAIYGFVDIGLELIKRGAKLDIENVYWETPLFIAAIRGHAAFAKMLVENGAALEHKNADLRTLLHQAAVYPSTVAVKILLELGARVTSAVDIFGRDVIENTVLYSTPEILKLLLEKLEASRKCLNSNNALPIAVYSMRFQEVELLVKHGADINRRFENTNTLLHNFVINSCSSKYIERFRSRPWNLDGEIKMLHLLIDLGADLDAKGQFGFTPLHVAAYNHNTAIALVLVDRGASTTITDDVYKLTAKACAEMLACGKKRPEHRHWIRKEELYAEFAAMI